MKLTDPGKPVFVKNAKQLEAYERLIRNWSRYELGLMRHQLHLRMYWVGSLCLLLVIALCQICAFFIRSFMENRLLSSSYCIVYLFDFKYSSIDAFNALWVDALRALMVRFIGWSHFNDSNAGSFSVLIIRFIRWTPRFNKYAESSPK